MVSTKEPLAYRIVTACQVLGIGRTKLYSLIHNGDIKAVKIGRRVLVPRTELEALLHRLQSEKS